jgi:hypothetical protein
VQRRNDANADSGVVRNLLKRRENSELAPKLDKIQELADSNDPGSVAALGAYLADSERAVKEAALEALGDREGSLVTQTIRRGLNDIEADFRIAVLEVLAERGDLDSIRMLKSDSDPDVRERVKELLEDSSQ